MLVVSWSPRNSPSHEELNLKEAIISQSFGACIPMSATTISCKSHLLFDGYYLNILVNLGIVGYAWLIPIEIGATGEAKHSAQLAKRIKKKCLILISSLAYEEASFA